MLRLFFIIYLVVLGSVSIRAQQILRDSSYLQSFSGTFAVRTYLGEKVSGFSLMDGETSRTINYYPNNILGLGMGINVHGVAINFSTRLPFHDPKIDRYGRTQRYDIQMHRYKRKVMLDAYLQRYTGFHLNDKKDVTMITGPEEFPYFPNLQALTIGATGLYVFNGNRYSLRGMTTQQDWQLRSAGSAMLGASVFTHFFDDDSSVLPVYYTHSDFFGGRHPKKIHYYGLTVSAGYGYTLVLDQAAHYFIAGSLDIGAGPGYSQVEDITGDQLDHVTLCVSGNLRLGFGYNSQKWFAGIYGILHADRYPLPYAESALSTRQGIGRLVVARRLVTKNKFLAQPAD